MESKIFLLIFVALSFFGGAAVNAKVAPEGNPLDDENIDKPVLKAHSLFPKNPFGRFESGSENELLIGLTNEGNQNLTIFSLSGSYRNPSNLSIIVQNLTSFRTQLVIPPGLGATLSYPFKPETESMDVGLVVLVDFTDESQKRWYQVVGHSSMISIVEPSYMFDYQLIILYVIGSALFIWLSIFVKDSFFGKSTKKPASKAKPVVERGTKNANEVENEWIPESHLKKSSAKARKA